MLGIEFDLPNKLVHVAIPRTLDYSPGEQRSTGSLGGIRPGRGAGRGGIPRKKRHKRDHRTSGNAPKQTL